jgi:type III pantothenate kinase
VGKNTVHAMQSGVVWGYIGLVEGIIARLRRDMGEIGAKAKVIGTGGLARLLAEHTTCMDIVDPNLTLDGLRMIYELNRDA